MTGYGCRASHSVYNITGEMGSLRGDWHIAG